MYCAFQESSVLLGHLVEHLPVTTESRKDGILTIEQVHHISHMFTKVLTRCRHRVRLK